MDRETEPVFFSANASSFISLVDDAEFSRELLAKNITKTEKNNCLYIKRIF